MRHLPTQLAGTTVTLLVLLGSYASIAAGQAPTGRSFAWFAELVSVDQAAGTVTVSAPITDPVAAYLDRFDPGEHVILVWTQYESEADAVMYISSADAMDVRSGYIVQAEYMGGDADGRTISFKT